MVKVLEKRSKNDLITEVIAKHFEIEKKNVEIEKLKHQVRLFQRKLFGSQKEQHIALGNPDQTKLAFEEKIDLDLPQDIEEQKVSYHRKKTNKKRVDYSQLELPAELRREVTIIEPLGKTGDMIKISEEVTEILAITQQEFYVKQIIRPKYSLPNKEGVLIAELPTRPIPGGMVHISVLIMLLLDKYIDHLPLHRQIKKYERLGVKLSDSTVGDWTAKTITLLELLYDELVKRVREGNYIQADESPIQVLDKLKKGTTHRGYYWVYHDVKNGLVVYEYDKGRGQAPVKEFLQDYKGILQTDGYAVYEGLQSSNIKLACCMAHARRYFFEAKDNDKARAEAMLEKIQSLYVIEKIAREQNYTQEQRLQVRQEKSIPILNDMELWLSTNLIEVTPKSPIGKAIIYMKARWDKLKLFASEGILEIDNNLVENVIRPIALGRKNYLFAGSHEAARRAGIVYSLVACCKKNGIDPYVWFTETLTKISETKSSELYKLLPTKHYNNPTIQQN